MSSATVKGNYLGLGVIVSHLVALNLCISLLLAFRTVSGRQSSITAPSALVVTATDLQRAATRTFRGRRAPAVDRCFSWARHVISPLLICSGAMSGLSFQRHANSIVHRCHLLDQF